MTDLHLVRNAPPDRRAPVEVRRGTCAQGESCFCCLIAASPRGHRNCHREHPAQDRMCNPPYPSVIPPCKERQTLPQVAPEPPPGFYKPNQACCVECGRATARRWTGPNDRPAPWCAGTFPDPRKKDPRV